MSLTDTAVRSAKPKPKAYAMADGQGLSLHVSPNGSKAWHFRFYWDSRQQRISFGTYPEISLRDARERREKARSLIARGIDPRSADKAAGMALRLFGDVAEEWYVFKSDRWAQDSRKGSKEQARRVLDSDILPKLRKTPFIEVTRGEVVAAIKRIEDRGALNIAKKARSWIRQIFDYGIAMGYRDNNPATGIEVIAKQAPPVQHNPIVSKEGEDIKLLVKGIKDYGGGYVTQVGLWTMLYTGVRTIEVRRARAAEFDLDAALWTIPPTAVKQLRGKVRIGGEDVPDYLVPLPSQMVAHLKPLLHMTRNYPYAFAGRNNPMGMMSENTLNTAIKRIGLDGKLTGHGMRGTISTALYEMGYPEHLVESQLSHADPNKSKSAYNHAAFVEERRAMMQAWADYLDGLLDQA